MANRRSFLKFLGLAPVAAAGIAEAKPVAMDIDEAVRKLEEGRIVKDGLPTYCCQTGNQYTVITHAGFKAEGAEFLGYNSTREEAVRGWLDHALMYAKDRPGVLYWRERPQLDCRIKDGKEDWMVYSRFVITDNLEVFPTVESLGDPFSKVRPSNRVYSEKHKKTITVFGEVNG